MLFHRAIILDILRSNYRHARNQLLFRDPGLSRLTFSARTVLALLVTGVVCHSVAVWGNYHTSGVILAVIAVQLTCLLARQPARHDRIATCLVMIPGNWAGILMLYALHAHPFLDIMILPVLIGAGFLAQAFNARLGAAVLAAAWIFMFTLYLSAAGIEPAWHLVAVTLGILTSMLLRFVIWRDDRMLSASLLVLSHRLALIDFLEVAASQGVDIALTRLQSRMQLVANAIVANPRISESLRDALADLRLSLEVAVLEEPASANSIANALRAEKPVNVSQVIDHAVQRVDAQLQEIGTVRHASNESSGAGAGGGPMDLSTRHVLINRSVQVFVATGLAAGIGYQISDHYWTWAVIVAMFLYLGTESAGHILDKGLNSALGVVLGVLVATVLTYLLAAAPQVEIVLVPLLLFMALYLMPVNYALGAALITVILGLVYQLLGLSAPSLLLLRLGEVIAGAAAGALASLLIFPHRPITLFNQRAAHLISGFADALDPQGEPIRQAELRLRFTAALASANLGRLGGLMIEGSHVKAMLANLSRMLHLAEVLQRLLLVENMSIDDASGHHRTRLAHDLRELACRMKKAETVSRRKSDQRPFVAQVAQRNYNDPDVGVHLLCSFDEIVQSLGEHVQR